MMLFWILPSESSDQFQKGEQNPKQESLEEAPDADALRRYVDGLNFFAAQYLQAAEMNGHKRTPQKFHTHQLKV
jgi:hypothetical protein